MSAINLEKMAGAMGKFALTMKGAVKILLQSRPCKIGCGMKRGERLIVMGNGPSLADTIRDSRDSLMNNATLAVNFAANTPEFFELKPDYYVIADPVFFASGNEKVDALWANLAKVDWPMVLFVPMRERGRRVASSSVSVEGFNFVGAEGFDSLTHAAYRRGLAMPRPRNVLVPSIMCGMKLGYKEIYLTGADHSWTRTLDVSEENEVVTVQPHFYKDDEAEKRRVATVYRNIHLHDILLSFHIAFKSYFDIRRFAEAEGVEIINSTPGSFIDAFKRGSLPE